MEYELKSISLLDAEANSEVADLLAHTYGFELAKDKLKHNTYTNKGKSLYIGAYKDGKLAGFNAFIQHDFNHQQQVVESYQSCWSATHSEHRGKGIFAAIINEAKRILKERGAAFIFGFPNENSHPIFVKKLGFYEVPLMKVQAPVMAFSLTKHFLLQSIDPAVGIDIADCYTPNELQIIELKEQELNSNIRIYSAYNNTIWGKKREKVYRGMKLSYFSVGGIVLNKPHLFSQVLAQLVQKERASYIEIIGATTNVYFQLFKNAKPAPHTEPLIIFDLNVNTSPKSNFNLFTGIKDVF
ncbi:MAG: GNAT family N-acetyltransferase [Bacteroidetes bacterium]|nr:GNAT family N-acetyltransferase [Bacteroidota bacterium]